MPEAANLTPMFRQYRSLKEVHADAVLLFRMGDFYEMFFEDARVAAPLLELTLTARGKGTDFVVPMCGFPHHQLDTYAARLVRANRKVAVCEQVEDPKKAKGLVRREVVRVITPGTLNDLAQLEPKENVWLAAVASVAGRLGAAFLDATTGEFIAWETADEDEASWQSLEQRLLEFTPREIVFSEQLRWPEARPEQRVPGTVLTPMEPFAFSPDAAGAALERQLGVASLHGFGLRDRSAAIAAAGGLLQYVQDTQRSGLEHVDRIQLHEPSRHLLLDAATRRNLELERSIRDGRRAGSLLDAIDRTRTSTGGRLLRRWILAPLVETEAIHERQECVAELCATSDVRRGLREALTGVQDIERLTARTVTGSVNPRELLGLHDSLARLPRLAELASGLRAPMIRGILDGLDLCSDVVERIGSAIVEDPPISPREGGVIREGFSDELDELRSIRRDGRSFIASLEAAERRRTGIGSLKVRFNKVFGYFIEVSKANLHLVPEHYHRKQTVASGERYITPELKEHEAKVLHAQERIESLEQELFRALRVELASHAPRLKAAAAALARIDVLAAFAELAASGDYCRPHIDDEGTLRIVGGRHPVVEQHLPERRFVPNDTELQRGDKAIAVLTGPNMGGKSTYLRQVAQITLLAQTGSFVPAEEARVGIVDRIFCRVGASDSLVEGQSTFMLEMCETANILHHASSRSLLLLDEIGRGTSTFDGLSIAWAVVEHLSSLEEGAPRTLFATHYHEMTELAVESPSVFNLRMAVREWGDRVVFLHRVEPGASDRSYGIHVAQLAGVPRSIVARAAEILRNLERDEYGGDGRPRRARGSSRTGEGEEDRQASLFTLLGESEPAPAPFDGTSAEVLAELRLQDPDRLTPLEALNLIAAWARRLRATDEG